VVCRSCGRITALDLRGEELQLLVALAARHPDEWRVDGVAFSLTGLCPSCRSGLEGEHELR
jgi:Fe2+ or Zn2+ uptake regulation protein